MAQLSRTKKYQELRNRLEEETTTAQMQNAAISPSRLSRAQASNLSHANRPVHPHDQINPKPMSQELPKSPVMDDLLNEVKQYNVDNGYRYTDDTQINILKQLDGNETRRRNAHFIPMEEDQEVSGNTMEMDKPMIDDVDGVQTFMPNQKLTRINPIQVDDTQEEPQKEDVLPFDDIELEYEQPIEVDRPMAERIVLSNEDIHGNEDELSNSEEITFFNDNYDEFDRTAEQEKVKPVKKAPKKVKKTKKKAVKQYDNIDDLPSAKMRMKAGDIENSQALNKSKKSGTILNVILIILIILLLISIAVTIYFVMNMGL